MLNPNATAARTGKPPRDSNDGSSSNFTADGSLNATMSTGFWAVSPVACRPIRRRPLATRLAGAPP